MVSLKERGGWLKNPDRRARMEQALGFTDKDALKLIKGVDKVKHYISKNLGRGIEESMRLRDKALIALAWVFFKRGGEVVKLKRKDVIVTETSLLVTFTVQKKQKRYKICANCGTKNGYKNKSCRECGDYIENVLPIIEGKPKIVTKRKTIQNKFVKYVTDWVQKLDDIAPEDKDTCFFPPLRVAFYSAYFDYWKPMTVANFNRILQRLDPYMTSCLFRYGGVEKYLSLGYSPRMLKEIGDWESSRMPEIYAERKGLTPTQVQWSEDTR